MHSFVGFPIVMLDQPEYVQYQEKPKNLNINRIINMEISISGYHQYK